ncbi:sugar ABC transporter substrate-binding protein [Paenibacillus filicis]|uniref:Sugar ABC transporter substrate-binding protein n=1 Tax=Paenibacillus gyeongsangnamensis TaxID=3388067 RepID=A0ABT4QAI3_9BACL|nr:sugar ABC transporter substrate-binding protein [Paenibacillus filicis]MCZ8513881.1 sugar ABC transporter substrate-binding protein [Paenibacillus filicis]
MGKKVAAACTILVATMVSALAGCSSDSGDTAKGNSGSADSAASSKPVTINFWGRWPEVTGVMNETIAEFQKKYPNITVKYTDVPSVQYVAQVQTALSGQDLPDIFGYTPSIPTYQLTALDAIMPLNDVIPEDKRKQYYDGTWSEGYTTMKGNIYAIPIFNPLRPSFAMYYNKEVLKSAGLTEKDIPKSWDQLYDFSKKVKENTNGQAYGVVVGIKPTTYMSSILVQMATSVTPEVIPDSLGPFNYKTGKYEFNSPGIIQTLQMFKKLQDEKLLHPNSLVMSAREGTALMEGGKVALVLDGVYFASQMQKDKLANYGVAPLPTFDGKPQYNHFYGESKVSLHVAKTTKNPKEVKLFLQFLADNLYPKLVSSGIEYSPIPSINENTKVNHPVAEQALKIQSKNFVLIPRPFQKNAETIKVATEMSGKMPKTTLSDISEGYLTGQIKDLKQALDQLTNDSNKVFSDALKKVQSSGAKVSESDYIFPDWKPYEPYGAK